METISLHKNDQALVFELLIAASMAVIIFFALMNIGTYLNGTVSDSLTDTYATNTKSGTTDYNYWHNGTTTTYRNISLPCAISDLNTVTTKFYISATKAITYSMSANGQSVNASSTLASGKTYTKTLAALITAGNVTVGQRYLNFSWTVNNTNNNINVQSHGTYYLDSDFRTSIENNTYDSLKSISAGYDDNIDIMVVAAIICMITIPLAAVVAIKKLM